MRPLYLILSFCIPFFAQAQKDFSSQIKQFQDELNKEYNNPATSPLPAAELSSFKGLPFFAPDSNYRVKAKLTRIQDAEPFEMPTTTKRRPIYKLYGVAEFTLKGKKHKLNLYKPLQIHDPAYKDLLFLPFTDLTNGVETYGGGRYIDLKETDKDSIVIDFNKAYNPYCAYNHNYSCPLVPPENALDIMIPAGVKFQSGGFPLRMDRDGFSILFPAEPTSYSNDTTGKKVFDKYLAYIGEIESDSNFVFQLEVKYFPKGTCQKQAPDKYNPCFESILNGVLAKTKGSLMYLKRNQTGEQETYEFEVLAQAKALTKYKVVLADNKAVIASVVTLATLSNNEPMEHYLNSLRVF